MSVHVPKYCRHPNGQAYVNWQRRRIYLGKYGLDESRTAYQSFIKKHILPLLDAPKPAASVPMPDVTISVLAASYASHLRDTVTREAVTTWSGLLSFIVREVGEMLADDFGPLDLKDLRQKMIDQTLRQPDPTEVEPRKPLARTYANQCVERIRRMFRWGVENEMISVDVLKALEAVQGLRAGRSNARETDPIRPAPADAVDAVIAQLHPILADMVRLQRLTGMRSAELCIMRPCDIEQNEGVWIYRPSNHKTAFRGKHREIPIGPRGQIILLTYIERPNEQYLWSPADVVDELNRQRRTRRKKPGVRMRVRAPGSHYTSHSYRRAIDRVIDKINEERTKKNEPLIEAWHPHQLRHSLATAVRKKHGLEAAQVMLGHARADVTQVYAERDLALAVKIAAEVG